MIYLDYAAHTPAAPEVLACLTRMEQRFVGNPLAAHAAGRAARAALDEAARRLAGCFGVSAAEVVFTSGASEANNHALKGLVRAGRHRGRHILSTCLEHPSVSGPLTVLQEQGCEVELIDVRRDGTVDLTHLRELMRPDTVLVSVCLVDGELGAVQPVEEIAALLRDYPGCRFHVDASQAAGKRPVSFEGIDCLTFSAHKFYGPAGCGGLLVRAERAPEPLIHGGRSASAHRSGTPALPLAAAAAEALTLACEHQAQWRRIVEARRAALLKAFRAYPQVRINSPADGSPYILNLSVGHVPGGVFQAALDRRGVCVSVKSACCVPDVPSRPVLAVSRDRKNARCSWRVSLSHLTTQRELDAFLKIFDDCYKELAT
ncbi:MAG: aminotransferase class V-fold PLP-dependent enzyme [Oscillospiraceae bacterium]|jgi:cysteine desulfurase|nr:aminotransferase class V-fold PLP-dependent enzyme [Oscillospiraceae bacterium]